MTRLHNWSELNQNLSPESRQRIAELEAEIDATMPPDESCAVVPMRMLREHEDAPLSEYAAELGPTKPASAPLRSATTLWCPKSPPTSRPWADV